VRQAHDERLGRLDDVAPDPGRDPPERVLRERLGAVEDARARERPVDALGRRAPRLEVPIEEACLPLRVGMSRLRPDDRSPVAPRYEEQPLADGRRAEVARSKLPPLDVVAEVAELGEPSPEREAATHRARAAVVGERPPVLELFDVLEDDDPRLDGLGPPHDDPGQAADALVDRLPALGL
jgi:hypothetical protein